MKKNSKWIIGIVGIALLVMIPQLISSGYTQQSIIMILLYAYWATCWNIVSGFAGSISMGHATYIGIGAYVTTILLRGYEMSPWIGMLVAGLVAGIVSLMIGYPCFKLRGSYFTLSTVALLHVLRLIITSNETLFGFQINGARGLDIPWHGERPWMMHFMDKRWYLYIIMALLVLALFVSHRITRSRMGYYLAAVNTNQEAAASLGVNVTSYKLRVMFISAFLTALGGAFYSQLIIFVDPQRVFGYDLSAEIMFFSVIGGMGTVWGPAIGAILMVPINEFTRVNFSDLSGLSMFLYGLIFMAVVYFMPTGVYGKIREVAGKVKRRADAGQKKAAEGGAVYGKENANVGD